jgi:hypothetical protein
MNQSGLVALAIFAFGATGLRAADATSPIDYTQRNAPFSATGSVEPQKQAPLPNRTLQEKRVEKPSLEKQMAPLSERRANVEVKETREKDVREKNSHRPDTIEQPRSVYNHRTAGISTGADTTTPPTVAKYQDSLAAASATNMARFPAVDRATTAKINRFVFRKNPSEPSPVVGANPVTPAAGGSPLQK